MEPAEVLVDHVGHVDGAVVAEVPVGVGHGEAGDGEGRGRRGVTGGGQRDLDGAVGRCGLDPVDQAVIDPVVGDAGAGAEVVAERLTVDVLGVRQVRREA